VDFEAACSVYIRFRGVNGYDGDASCEMKGDLQFDEDSLDSLHAFAKVVL